MFDVRLQQLEPAQAQVHDERLQLTLVAGSVVEVSGQPDLLLRRL
jgi:hypothetical protein